MVGETKDPSNPKAVATSVFAAVAVYAVRIFLLFFLISLYLSFFDWTGYSGDGLPDEPTEEI